MNIRHLDLNLLVALEALLRHQGVTAAGDDVGLSQPAMSNALSRLRRMFDDELLVRVGRTMQLTPRAQALIEPVTSILRQIEEAVETPSFDPKTSTRQFTIVTADYITAVLVPVILRRLAEEAPRVRVHVVAAEPTKSRSIPDIDLWINPADFLTNADIPHRFLFTDRWMCAVSTDHPEVGDEITREQFLELPQIAFSVEPGVDGSDSLQLRRLGVQRHLQVALPSFVMLPYMLRGTRLVALIQERLGRQLAPATGIKLLSPPFDLAPIELVMVWNPRFDRDPGHEWFRSLVIESAEATESSRECVDSMHPIG